MMETCVVHALPWNPDPCTWFAGLRGEPGAVLLDSGRPGATRGRYDILSAWPRAVLTPEDHETGHAFLQRLRAALATLGPVCAGPSHARPAKTLAGAALPFSGGLLGYLGYEFGYRLENGARSAEGVPAVDAPRASDACFGLYDWALINDHDAQTSQLVFHPACPAETRARVINWFETPPQAEACASDALRGAPFRLCESFSPTISRDAYRTAIERIHAYIAAGDCYQVNYTQRFQARYQGDPWAAYVALRRACPTPFSGYVSLGDGAAVLSLSPERFLRLENGRIEARPIKGTRPRGNTPETDAQQAATLCASEKDRAENVMIVDLLRNDIGRSSTVGSVRVPELCSLESYPNVHHLVSSVEARLADGLDVFDLLAGSFPGGSITGAPKIRAMQIIDELEPHARSVYCGSLLYIDVNGNMDSSITIRSLLAEDGRISVWGGGGIVMDSDWQEEYQESLDKVGVLMRTLEGML